MRREGWYALITGLLCLIFAGGWAAWRAPQFAAPQMSAHTVNVVEENTTPLPVPPQLNQWSEEAGDLPQLQKRSLFTAAADRPKIEPKPEVKLKSKPQDTAKTAIKSKAKPTPKAPTAAPKPRSVIPNISGKSETAAQPQPAHIGAGQSGQVLLRGVLTSETGTTALVQLPDKSIVDVRVGQMIGEWAVLTIDENGIVLGRGGEKVRLVLP